MKKIYTVEVGQYSDHHILGCFSDRDVAERYAKHYNRKQRSSFSDEAWVAINYLDAIVPEIPRGQNLFFVIFDEHGEADIEQCGRTWQQISGYDCVNEETGQFYTHVLASDKKKALKIARDRRAYAWALKLGLG